MDHPLHHLPADLRGHQVGADFRDLDDRTGFNFGGVGFRCAGNLCKGLSWNVDLSLDCIVTASYL